MFDPARHLLDGDIVDDAGLANNFFDKGAQSDNEECEEEGSRPSYACGG